MHTFAEHAWASAVLPEADEAAEPYPTAWEVAQTVEVSVGALDTRRLYGEMGIVRTPLVESRLRFGAATLLIKDETMQQSGAFKSRGAASGVLRAAERSPLHVLVTASAGNHALGVAQAGNALGLQTIVECPADISPAKRERLLAAGVTLHAHHSDFDAAKVAALRYKDAPGTAYIDPFDHPDVIAGQSTMGTEIMQDLLARAQGGKLDLHKDSIIIPVAVGGGGELAGIALAVHSARQAGVCGANVRVVGVQMEGCDAMNRAVRNVRQGLSPINLFAPSEFNSRCDGTAVKEVGRLTLPIAAEPALVSGIYTVTEAQLGHAMRRLSAEQFGKRVEPAGALSMAGAMLLAPGMRPRHGDKPPTFVTITCGGNVTAATYQYFNRVALGEQARTLGVLSTQTDQSTLYDVRPAASYRHGTTIAAGP